MNCTLEKVLTDAKSLVERLRNHDNAAEMLIEQTTSLNKRVDAMKQVYLVVLMPSKSEIFLWFITLAVIFTSLFSHASIRKRLTHWTRWHGIVPGPVWSWESNRRTVKSENFNKKTKVRAALFANYWWISYTCWSEEKWDYRSLDGDLVIVCICFFCCWTLWLSSVQSYGHRWKNISRPSNSSWPNTESRCSGCSWLARGTTLRSWVSWRSSTPRSAMHTFVLFVYWLLLFFRLQFSNYFSTAWLKMFLTYFTCNVHTMIYSFHVLFL